MSRSGAWAVSPGEKKKDGRKKKKGRKRKGKVREKKRKLSHTRELPVGLKAIWGRRVGHALA